MNAVTYEITAEVREDLCEKYEQFMIERHIPDLSWQPVPLLVQASPDLPPADTVSVTKPTIVHLLTVISPDMRLDSVSM